MRKDFWTVLQILSTAVTTGSDSMSNKKAIMPFVSVALIILRHSSVELASYLAGIYGTRRVLSCFAILYVGVVTCDIIGRLWLFSLRIFYSSAQIIQFAFPYYCVYCASLMDIKLLINLFSHNTYQ